MSAATANKKKPRTLHYNQLAGALYITQGKDESGYWLDSIRHDFGPAVRCVRLSKFIANRKEGQAEAYDVCVNVKSRTGSCECMGHLRHGHKTVCRHVAAVIVLADRGSI